MKTVGVFFGSRSPEHDISIITAMRVMEGFSQLHEFRPTPVYIDKKGMWYFGDALGNMKFFRNPQYELLLEDYALHAISWENEKLILTGKKRGFFSSAPREVIDIAFPCFHGSFGEDGTIQGLFEMASIPYVGCGVRASAVAMSKIHTRRLLRDADIPNVPTLEVPKKLFEQDRIRVREIILQNFTYPFFVKPNNLGSSIGISRVSHDKELEWALELVFQFDTLTLIEEEVKNLKEINILAIGHKEIIVSLPEEPKHHAAFQDFETKYLTKGGTIRQEKSAKTKSIIPAEISKEMTEDMQAITKKVFRLLECSGIMRCEFLLNDQTKEFFLGEVNTLPGTLYAHVWQASGIPLPELIKKLLSYAEERHEEEKSLTRVFASGVLQR